MAIAPDVPYNIGDAAFGGYVAGVIDTTKGNIIAADASQVGQRYILIVSPKSMEQSSLAWRTANAAAPAASRTRWNGLAATASMANATYPAANYCNNLSSPADGGSKWYLPAMDELELIYRHLKSTTEANYVGSQGGGEFPAGTVYYGQNPSSDPTTPTYTSGAPARTAVAAFRDGGGQNLGRSGVNDYYWTATEYSAASNAWSQGFSGPNAGNQSNNNKTAANWVRPVRRVLASDLNRAPNAPAVSVPSTVNLTADTIVNVGFSDPDAGDSASWSGIRFRHTNITPTPAWTTITRSSPDTHVTVPAATLTAGDYELQGASRDAQGTPVADADLIWSTSSFFTAGTPPDGLVITDPLNGATFDANVLLKWSTPVQDAYQVQVLDGATVISDTGEVVDPTARQYALTFPDNNVTRTIQARRKYGGLWQAQWTAITGPVSYTPPAAPTVTKTEDPASGRLLVTVTNPAPGAGQPATAYNDIRADDLDGLGLDYRFGSRLVATNSTWTYWLPRAGIDTVIEVSAIGTNGTRTVTTTTTAVPMHDYSYGGSYS